MPRIITCKYIEDKRFRRKCLQLHWDVGSDDFFLPAIIAIVIGFFNIILLLAVLFTLYFRPVCLELAVSPLLYAPLFALLAIEVAFILIEGIILIVSAKGTIMNTRPRRIMSKLIYIRIVVAVLELFGRIASTVGVWHSSVTSLVKICPDFGVGLHFAQAIVLFLWVLYIGFLIKVVTYIDPLGCCSPGLLEHLPLDSADRRKSTAEDQLDIGEMRNEEYHSTKSVPYWTKRIDVYNVRIGEKKVEDLEEKYLKGHSSNVGQTRLLRRLQTILCCLGVKGHRSRGMALEDVARTLYTLFGDVNLVFTDIVAGLFLLNQDQRRRKANHISLNEKFRKGMLKVMPGKQRFNRNPETMTPPAKRFDFSKLEDQLLFEDLVHYMHYAMGMYGWPLHVFDHLCCGFCELCTVTCCKCNYRCLNKRAKTSFIKEDCCMCGVGTIQLRTDIPQKDILFASYKNKINKIPFSVCVDDKMKAIVVCVRGTLSIKDALTDMSFSPVPIPVPAREQTFVHGGMMRSAEYIMKKLQKQRLLEEAFAEKGRQGYKLVVVGHSLGAGVASVLALLLKLENKYPMMVCYAYSPPGALFSYPLAEYSKQFITTVVVGNDIIPRFTPQSLVYLKVSVEILLKRCNKPKYQVLFHRRCCRRVQERCGREEDREESRKRCRDGTKRTAAAVSDGDEVDGEGGVRDEFDVAIEEVLNKDTTHKSLQEALFNRSASVQATSPGLFSRSVTAQVQQEFSRKFKRAVSIDTTLTSYTIRQRPPLISQPTITEDTDGQSSIHIPFQRSLSTAATEGVLSSELFIGTEGTLHSPYVPIDSPRASFEHRVVADSSISTPMTTMEERMKEHTLAHEGDVYLPFFPPGRVIHIDEDTEDEEGSSCCSSNQRNFIVQDVANEELCVIIVEHGMIEHHLPNYVLNALKVCKTRHLLSNKSYDRKKLKELRDKNEILRSRIRGAILQPSKQFEFLKLGTPTAASLAPLDDPDGRLEERKQRKESPRRAFPGGGGVRVRKQSNLRQIPEVCEGNTEMNMLKVPVEVHEHAALQSQSHNTTFDSHSTHPLTHSQQSSPTPNVTQLTPDPQLPPGANTNVTESTPSPNRSRVVLHLPLDQGTAARKTFSERKKAANLHVKIDLEVEGNETHL